MYEYKSSSVLKDSVTIETSMSCDLFVNIFLLVELGQFFQLDKDGQHVSQLQLDKAKKDS